MVRDLGDQANEWMPFIFYNKVEYLRYETFFCLLNIEKMAYDIKIKY